MVNLREIIGIRDESQCNKAVNRMHFVFAVFLPIKRKFYFDSSVRLNMNTIFVFKIDIKCFDNFKDNLAAGGTVRPHQIDLAVTGVTAVMVNDDIGIFNIWIQSMFPHIQFIC